MLPVSILSKYLMLPDLYKTAPIGLDIAATNSITMSDKHEGQLLIAREIETVLHLYFWKWAI